MQAKHSNMTTVCYTFTEKLKAMQNHITTTGHYSKQVQTHTLQAQEKNPHMQSLPCWSDSEKQEMKKLNAHA